MDNPFSVIKLHLRHKWEKDQISVPTTFLASEEEKKFEPFLTCYLNQVFIFDIFLIRVVRILIFVSLAFVPGVRAPGASSSPPSANLINELCLNRHFKVPKFGI